MQLFLLYKPADIDECKPLNNRCDNGQRCNNTEGGFECLCLEGYSKNRNGKGCHSRNIVAKVAIGKHQNISPIYFQYKFYYNFK